MIPQATVVCDALCYFSPGTRQCACVVCAHALNGVARSLACVVCGVAVITGPATAPYNANTGCGIAMASSASLDGPWTVQPLIITNQFESDEMYVGRVVVIVVVVVVVVVVVMVVVIVVIVVVFVVVESE